MENREMSTLEEVRQQLRRFPTPVADEFEKARGKMPRTVDGRIGGPVGPRPESGSRNRPSGPGKLQPSTTA